MEANILLGIQNNRHDFLTPVLQTISHIGDYGLIWLILAGFFLLSGGYRLLGVKILAALTLVLLLNNMLLKNLVDRPRPYETISDLIMLGAVPSGASFPSGHTAGAFAACWLLYKYLPKKYGVSLVILGILMGFSRMYVGVHYLSDVLGGAICGCLCGWLADGLVRRLLRLKA